MRRWLTLLFALMAAPVFAHVQTLASGAGTFAYGYGTSPAAFVRTLTLPNGAWITNHFDSLERLDYTALVNHWGHVLDGYAYTHDPLGLRTNLVRDLGLTTNSVTEAEAVRIALSKLAF